MSPPVVEQDFTTATDQLRGELLAHCYRMLGSVQDAEDQVQETYLRAWRAYHSFEGRSSLRTWMYRIATRTCLTALERRARRPLPAGLGTPDADPATALAPFPRVPGSEPLPDALTALSGTDPAAVAVTRDSVRLAFVAALHHLTPLQRAVLILRDVLAFSAVETAATLDLSVASVNSALQRARAGLARGAVLDDGASSRTAHLLDRRERALLDRYLRAFEDYDTATVVALLAEDATWGTPPFTGWGPGAAAIETLLRTRPLPRSLSGHRVPDPRARGS